MRNTIEVAVICAIGVVIGWLLARVVIMMVTDVFLLIDSILIKEAPNVVVCRHLL